MNKQRSLLSEVCSSVRTRNNRRSYINCICGCFTDEFKYLQSNFSFHITILTESGLNFLKRNDRFI